MRRDDTLRPSSEDLHEPRDGWIEVTKTDSCQAAIVLNLVSRWKRGSHSFAYRLSIEKIYFLIVVKCNEIQASLNWTTWHCVFMCVCLDVWKHRWRGAWCCDVLYVLPTTSTTSQLLWRSWPSLWMSRSHTLSVKVGHVRHVSRTSSSL